MTNRDKKVASRTLELLVLPGDGIGPEVIEQALAVLKRVSHLSGLGLNIHTGLIGGASLSVTGKPISTALVDQAKQAGTVLLGAVGSPVWDGAKGSQRPEQALLILRAALDVYANLRPASLPSALRSISPLVPRSVTGLDLLVVRELTGGIYFGQPRGTRTEPVRQAFNTMVYSEAQIRRIGRVAFGLARSRRARLTNVDKANVLEVQALWREIIKELAQDYPDVNLEHLYVDNCAMQLVLNPLRFDVLVCSNLFGDILSDLTAAIVGSIGLLPSASLGEECALYEPVHGSAPDIAGTNQANPLAAILSVAMLLQHSAQRPDLANWVNQAVLQVLYDGLRTPDLKDTNPDCRQVGTRQMGQAVVHALETTAETFLV